MPPSQGPQFMASTRHCGQSWDSFWAALFNTSLAMA